MDSLQTEENSSSVTGSMAHMESEGNEGKRISSNEACQLKMGGWEKKNPCWGTAVASQVDFPGFWENLWFGLAG